jgi:hypothetical protein
MTQGGRSPRDMSRMIYYVYIDGQLALLVKVSNCPVVSVNLCTVPIDLWNAYSRSEQRLTLRSGAGRERMQ